MHIKAGEESALCRVPCPVRLFLGCVSDALAAGPPTARADWDSERGRVRPPVSLPPGACGVATTTRLMKRAGHALGLLGWQQRVSPLCHGWWSGRGRRSRVRHGREARGRHVSRRPWRCVPSSSSAAWQAQVLV